MGTAAFGKTRQDPLRPRLRVQRGRALQPRRAVSTVDVPQDEWVSIPVPALVEPEVFAAVQEQLPDNGTCYIIRLMAHTELCNQTAQENR
jgi:site-specific DNA recombinase